LLSIIYLSNIYFLILIKISKNNIYFFFKKRKMADLSPNVLRISIIFGTIIILLMIREVYHGYLIELNRFQSSTLLQGKIAARWVLNEDKLKWFKRKDDSEYVSL